MATLSILLKLRAEYPAEYYFYDSMNRKGLRAVAGRLSTTEAALEEILARSSQWAQQNVERRP